MPPPATVVAISSAASMPLGTLAVAQAAASAAAVHSAVSTTLEVVRRSLTSNHIHSWLQRQANTMHKIKTPRQSVTALSTRRISREKGCCTDCDHRQGHHELDELMSSEDEDTSGPNILEIALGAIPPGSKGTAGKRQGGKAKIVSALFGQANKEVNKGMRPPVSTSEKPKDKGKAKSEVNDTIFKALAIVVVPDGVIFQVENSTFYSVRAKVPDKEEVQRLVGQGLAVLNQKGLDFCRTWSHAELADFLYAD
ncbi:hypothetical protein B0H14DRAFT_2628036 [Mycena olivaceomarginata]|nr:hypothetical protein B0H14DRAFT_2628036 [Mycena olivaceomarginata]